MKNKYHGINDKQTANCTNVVVSNFCAKANQFRRLFLRNVSWFQRDSPILYSIKVKKIVNPRDRTPTVDSRATSATARLGHHTHRYFDPIFDRNSVICAVIIGLTKYSAASLPNLDLPSSFFFTFVIVGGSTEWLKCVCDFKGFDQIFLYPLQLRSVNATRFAFVIVFRTFGFCLVLPGCLNNFFSRIKNRIVPTGSGVSFCIDISLPFFFK